jgi:hypothetical protein
VAFWNYFTKFPNGKESCQNEMNFIKIFISSMEILVELSGELMEQLFIDVLVRSSQSFIETFNFIQKNVLKKIEESCSATQGCQG